MNENLYLDILNNVKTLQKSTKSIKDLAKQLNFKAQLFELLTSPNSLKNIESMFHNVNYKN